MAERRRVKEINFHQWHICATLEGRHVSDLKFLSAAESGFCFNYPAKGRTTTVVTFFAPADKKLSFNLK